MSGPWLYKKAMSDGPHRTLNMRKAWKALAERADGAAYTHAEVVAYVAPAVSSDWKYEVAPAYLNEIGQYLGCGQQSHLFEKDPAEIDRLRRKASSPMEAAFAEYARDTSLRGDAALHDVVHKTMRECAVRRTLQAHEHWVRKSSPTRAAHMKGRMQAAVITASTGIFGAMAQSVVSGARMSVNPPAKRGGLDDGPALP
jgi:hypothetical protein